jgi:hypothetical protein
MNREVHVRICGRLGVKFPGPTRQQHPKCIFGMGESMGAAIVLQSVKTTPFCAVVAESSFASFRQIAYVRVGQFFQSGTWLGRIALRPAMELAVNTGV